MTRHEFLGELKGRLKSLPYDEVHEALKFYEQYFEDGLSGGDKTEEELTAELGSPAAIAAQLMAQFAVKESKGDKPAETFGCMRLLAIIGGLFAAIVALPIALGGVIALLAILFSAGVTLVSLWVAGIAGALGGVLSIVVGIVAIFTHFPTGIVAIGSGLVMFGVCVLLYAFTNAAARFVFGLIGRIVARFTKGRALKKSGERGI